MTLIDALLSVPAVRTAQRGAKNWLDLQESLLTALMRGVAPLARGRLVDVGCGVKPYEEIFRPYVTEYIGVEYEPTFVATAASSRAAKPDVVYDGTHLPFEAATFDTVLSVQVLEHTPKPNELLAEMARVLKPDGILILSAPFSFRLHEEPHDYFRYTPHGLRVMCEAVGLEVTETRPMGNLWSLLGHKLNSFLAFRVGRMQGAAQAMGKLGHESTRQSKPRYWTLPVVAPMMVGVSLAARVLDRAAPDPTESLGYLVLARRRG
jgi:SAM-dependent methyltransferase